MRDEKALIVEDWARLFLAKVLADGHWISANNRIGTSVGALLVGITPGHLRNLISQGHGPIQSGAGGGFKKTVSLLDLADWDYKRRHG